MQPRECVCPPAVFVYESFLLFFFYYLPLRILQFTFNLQYFSQYRVFALPLPWTLLPLLQHFSLRAVLAGQRAQKLGFLFIIPPFSAHTCFTFGIMFFSLCCFSFFLFFVQLRFVQSYFVLQFDNPWHQYDFSRTAPVHQEWTEPSLFMSFFSLPF